jgi:hypothetical protein
MKIVKLTNGYEAIVDDEDYESISVHSWFAWSSGPRYTKYAMRNPRDGGPRNMSGLILKSPDGCFIDHVNGNGLDNRKSNLRIATRSQNMFNTKKLCGPKRVPSSIYKGVKRLRGKKWQAQIVAYGQYRYLGTYPCQLCAALAYDLAALDFHGEYARTNIIYKI